MDKIEGCFEGEGLKLELEEPTRVKVKTKVGRGKTHLAHVVDFKDAVWRDPVVSWRREIDSPHNCLRKAISNIHGLKMLAEPDDVLYISTYPCTITSTQVEDVLEFIFLDRSAE